MDHIKEAMEILKSMLLETSKKEIKEKSFLVSREMYRLRKRTKYPYRIQKEEE